MRFAITVKARREFNRGFFRARGISIPTGIGLINANSEQEAIEIATAIAHKSLPGTDGWYGHQVQVIDVSGPTICAGDVIPLEEGQ